MMTEVVKTKIRELALTQTHQKLGAELAEREGWSVPASYGDELLEYGTVRERGAGLLDLSSRERLLVTGSEAVAFLNGLITNDMKTLAANHWMPAVFPNVQGRLVASVRVIRLADDDKGKPIFVIDTEAATHDRVVQTIQKFTLAGDFHVKDLTEETVLLSLQGKAAAEKLASVLDLSVVSIAAGSVTQIIWQKDPITVMRASHTAADGFDLMVNNTHAEQFWQALLAVGARPVGYDALEILRVEAGIPRYHQDMDETTVVTETNLDDAVSYTKGCYIGQEIIARIKYRGHVAKKLRGLVFEKSAMVATGTPIKSKDDKEIGQITSSVYSPHFGRRLALGYVKYDYIASGTEVKTSDGALARVVDLPFVN